MNRSLLATGQVLVVLFALAVRLSAPGWWLVIVVMTFGAAAAAVLSPLLLALGAAFAFAPALRPRTLIALAVADLAVLGFALTLPDFTDQYDDHLVPLAALLTSDGNVSATAAATFESVAHWSAITYIAASCVVFVLAVMDYRRASARTPSMTPGSTGDLREVSSGPAYDLAESNTPRGR